MFLSTRAKMFLPAVRTCFAFRPALNYELTYRCTRYRGYKYSTRDAKKPIGILQNIKDGPTLCRLKIHTTRRLHIPPVLALLVRPLVNVGAFLFGRYFKKWWARQTPEQREMYIKWLASKRSLFMGILAAFFSSLALYYVSHLETDPLTNRRRFIILNSKQQAALAKFIYQTHLEEHKNNLVPHYHPAYRRIMAVAKTLLYANKDIPFVADESWTLNVVDANIKNAYVLPGGHIFVFLGTLDMVDNDDQLAIILAHEMAHVLLKHPIEQLSNGVLFDIILAIPLVMLWSIFPDIVAFFAQAVTKTVLTIMLRLPYSRALEKEADEVGLNLAAKSCVDVREAVVFWATMKDLSDMHLQEAELPWLSTHPDSEERANFLNSKMMQAMELRMQAGCMGVPRTDPRIRFGQRTHKEKAALYKARGFTLGPNF